MLNLIPEYRKWHFQGSRFHNFLWEHVLKSSSYYSCLFFFKRVCGPNIQNLLKPLKNLTYAMGTSRNFTQAMTVVTFQAFNLFCLFVRYSNVNPQGFWFAWNVKNVTRIVLRVIGTKSPRQHRTEAWRTPWWRGQRSHVYTHHKSPTT